MRVNPDRQTLILAGETPPGRVAVANRSGSGSQRVTVISARVDAVVTETDYSPSTGTAYTAGTDALAYDAIDAATSRPSSPSSNVTTRAYSTYAPATRGAASGGAGAYARTQGLADRQPIIDTYA